MNDFTYPEFIDGEHRIILDECALSYNCSDEIDAYHAAIEQVDAIRDELVLKLERLTGEFYVY